MPTIDVSVLKPPRDLSVVSLIIEWVDLELHDSNKNLATDKCDFDLLLELRALFMDFAKGSSANRMIFGFCRLRSQINVNNYLLGYRIRQWMSLNFVMRLSDPLNRIEAKNYRIEPSERFIQSCKAEYMKQADDYISTSDLRVEMIAMG